MPRIRNLLYGGTPRRRRPCGESIASGGPAGSQPFEKVAKQTFTVTGTDLWSVSVTNLGSRGFISWPPEAQCLNPH